MTTMTAEGRSDAQLLQAHAQGDQGALEALIERRYDQAYRYCLRVLGNPSRADDAAQDAFVALIRGARRFDPKRAFGPWWGAILANTARDAVRSERRRHVREQRVTARSRNAAAESNAEHAEVESLVRGLPEVLRAPLTLHFYEGLTHREVASSLGCPPGTASSRIRRGLERLRKQLTAAGHSALIPQLERLLGEPSHATPPARPSAQALRAAAARSTAAALLVKAGLAACSILLLGLGLGLASSERLPAPLASASSSPVAPAAARAPSHATAPAFDPAEEPPEAWLRAVVSEEDHALELVGSTSVRFTPESAFDPSSEGLLQVRCLDERGEPVPAGRVELVAVDADGRPQGGLQHSLRLRDGLAAAVLPAGRYRCTVDCGEAYDSEAGRSVSVDLAHGERRKVQIDLLRLVEVRVSARERPQEELSRLDLAVESERRDAYVNTPLEEPKVLYAWPGEVRVTLLDARRGLFAQERFVAEPGERRECRLRLDQAAPWQLTGVVRGRGDQRPVAWAQVEVFAGDETTSTVWTDPDGTFSVWTVEPATRLHISGTDCVSAEVDVQDPSSRQVVELEREGRVAITLLTPAGTPASGVGVSARWTQADGRLLRAGSVVDARGVYEETLTAGDYSVSIEGVARTHTVTVRPGETLELTMRLAEEPR
jgi:RNA polymerase sigma-70 factor (ECF subfamily)